MATFTAQHLPYRNTGAFSSIILDYLEGNPLLRDFYAHPLSLVGIDAAIKERKQYSGNRSLLHNELQQQYQLVSTTDVVRKNIASLLKENTFTICTAHQPNIFTGHLYFIYKIIHAIKLADELNIAKPDCHFVPVYYMGSEDADLEELGEVVINGKKYEWQTQQKGAVGRMTVDKNFLQLITEIEAQLAVEPFGSEIMDIIKATYTPGASIEQATFELVNTLFGKYGLIVFLPDNPALKQAFYDINKKELEEKFSHQLVTATIAEFPEKYKIQAAGREINLFYLEADTRERIEELSNGFAVANTELFFTKEQLCAELKEHPERFSPNVILRPVFQELILPNIAFIGGGGELAYWLELKKVFEAVGVPFPVLILRNSFTLIRQKNRELMQKLPFSTEDYFKSTKELEDRLVIAETAVQLHLDDEKQALSNVYQKILQVSGTIDRSLLRHVSTLQTLALKRIELLEKKMLTSEKKKFEARLRQLQKMKQVFYPNNTLQERIDNLLPYYAAWGPGFLDALYEHASGLTMEYGIITEN